MMMMGMGGEGPEMELMMMLEHSCRGPKDLLTQLKDIDAEWRNKKSQLLDARPLTQDGHKRICEVVSKHQIVLVELFKAPGNSVMKTLHGTWQFLPLNRKYKQFLNEGGAEKAHKDGENEKEAAKNKAE